MNPPAPPSSTPVPIVEEIGSLYGFLTFQTIFIIGGGVVLVLLALGGFWYFVIRRRHFSKKLSPVEQALAELANLRQKVETSDPYPFSISVSDVLRIYLRDARGLSATTQTSREFLEAVHTHNVFNTEEHKALAAFLEKADLIKFARLHATSMDCSVLLEQAERLVRSRLSDQPQQTQTAA